MGDPARLDLCEEAGDGNDDPYGEEIDVRSNERMGLFTDGEIVETVPPNGSEGRRGDSFGEENEDNEGTPLSLSIGGNSNCEPRRPPIDVQEDLRDTFAEDNGDPFKEDIGVRSSEKTGVTFEVTASMHTTFCLELSALDFTTSCKPNCTSQTKALVCS